MDYAALRVELAGDPLTVANAASWNTGTGYKRPYAQLDDATAAQKLNAVDTGRTVPRTTVGKNELLGAIVDAEWPTTAILQNKLLTIFSCDTIDASNTNVKGIFAAIFGPATVTRTNLLALGARVVSRAEELGLSPPSPVTANDVKLARSGNW